MKSGKILKNEISALEEKLLSQETRRSAEALGKLLADDFVEIGKSGRKYQRTELIELLVNEDAPPPVVITEFDVAILAEDLVLATYKTVNGKTGVISVRSSIWHKRALHGWRMRFHQATEMVSGKGIS